MTVLEILQKEANIGQCEFFTKNWKYLDPNCWDSTESLLSESVYDYDTVPISYGFDTRRGRTFIEGAQFIPLSFKLRILLDKE